MVETRKFISYNQYIFAEETKYYRKELEELEVIFKERYLDWDYYLKLYKEVITNDIQYVNSCRGYHTSYSLNYDKYSFDIIYALSNFLYHTYDKIISRFSQKWFDEGLSYDEVYRIFGHMTLMSKKDEFIDIKVVL